MADMVTNYPTSGGTTATYNGQYFIVCMAKFTSTAVLSAGTLSGQVYFANTLNKSCTGSNVPAFLEWQNANGSVGGIAGGPYNLNATIPSSSAVAHYSWSGAVSSRTFTAGQQLYWVQNVTHGSTNCNGVTVYYNSGSYQTTITFPGWTGGASGLVTPNAPTGLTVTVNGDGTRTLNWTAPTSSSSVPAPDFYPIYRDGTTTGSRYDTTDALNTTVSTASSAGATTLTVANTNGYVAGQAVLVDTGANQDVMTISSIAGNTITFTTTMAHAHAVGVPVVLRAVSWIDTNTGGSSHTYRVTATSANLA